MYMGAEPIITDLSDNTMKEARLCQGAYEDSRRTVLTLHPWKFAKKRTILDTPFVTSPAFDYSAQFALPDDCLQVRLVNDSDSRWAVESGYVLCNYTSINLVYTWDQADPDKFHPQFIECLALHIAKTICYAYTQSNERETLMQKQFDQILAKARHTDAVQDSPPSLVANEFDNVRIGPNRGFVRDPMT